MAGNNTKTFLAVGGLAIAGYGVYKLLAKAPPSEEVASIYGTVVDSETVEPISGINVNLDSLLTTTDVNGEFLMENIEPGTYTLIFDDPQGRYAPEGMSITLSPGEARNLGTIYLTPAIEGITLVCRIADREFGLPDRSWGAKVTATSNVSGASVSSEMYKPGVAKLVGLEPGSEYTITITDVGYLWLQTRRWWRSYKPYTITCVPSEQVRLDTGEYWLSISIPSAYIYQEGPIY